MALGTFRKILTFGSFFFTTAALVLTILATVGTVNKSSKVIDSIHFIRLDLSSINLGSLLSDTSYSSVFSSSSISFSGEDFGFANTYAISNWGYCQSSETGKNIKYDNCTDAKAMYHFNFTEFLQDSLASNNYSANVRQLIGTNSALSITVPDKLDEYDQRIKEVSSMIFICSFIAIGVFGLQFFFNFIARKSHLASVLAFMMSFVGTLSVILAAAGATGMYLVIKDKIKSELGDTGIKGVIDPIYYGLIWGAAGAGICSCGGWFFSICCGRTDVVDHEEDFDEGEKE